MRKIILVALLPLAGCYNTAADLAEIPTEKTADLCVQYRGTTARDRSIPKAAIRAELDKRKALPASDWGDVDQRVIHIGMTTCALLAAWGNPDTSNRTTTVASDQYQWVYRTSAGAQYVYLENGRVMAFQDRN